MSVGEVLKLIETNVARGDEALTRNTKTKRQPNGARADNVNPLKATVDESSSSMIASGRGG
jgi:hypothetical protein